MFTYSCSLPHLFLRCPSEWCLLFQVLWVFISVPNNNNMIVMMMIIIITIRIQQLSHVWLFEQKPRYAIRADVGRCQVVRKRCMELHSFLWYLLEITHHDAGVCQEAARSLAAISEGCAPLSHSQEAGRGGWQRLQRGHLSLPPTTGREWGWMMRRGLRWVGVKGAQHLKYSCQGGFVLHGSALIPPIEELRWKDEQDVAPPIGDRDKKVILIIRMKKKSQCLEAEGFIDLCILFNLCIYSFSCMWHCQCYFPHSI